jgi:hypothetical protein
METYMEIAPIKTQRDYRRVLKEIEGLIVRQAARGMNTRGRVRGVAAAVQSRGVTGRSPPRR